MVKHVDHRHELVRGNAQMHRVQTYKLTRCKRTNSQPTLLRSSHADALVCSTNTKDDHATGTHAANANSQQNCIGTMKIVPTQ
jgi:hypothetical protein